MIQDLVTLASLDPKEDVDALKKDLLPALSYIHGYIYISISCVYHSCMYMTLVYI